LIFDSLETREAIDLREQAGKANDHILERSKSGDLSVHYYYDYFLLGSIRLFVCLAFHTVKLFTLQKASNGIPQLLIRSEFSKTVLDGDLDSSRKLNFFPASGFASDFSSAAVLTRASGITKLTN